MPHSIYVSGPIMAPNPDRADGLVTEILLKHRKKKFHEVSDEIRRHVGPTTTVINPLDIPACEMDTNKPVCDGVVNGPHGRGHSWRCYLRHDLEVLVMCHEVVMLEGWEGSPGANVEKSVAEYLGLEINYWCDKDNSAHPEGACK